jgi:hypothetical protein
MLSEIREFLRGLRAASGHSSSTKILPATAGVRRSRTRIITSHRGIFRLGGSGIHAVGGSLEGNSVLTPQPASGLARAC